MPLVQQEFSTPPPRPRIGAPAVPPPQKGGEGQSQRYWYTIGPGIWELLLNGNSDSDEKSVLQWYEPGAKSTTDAVIAHSYVEEVCFLEGGLRDLSLDHEWGQGAYAYRFPGMKHGPYRASARGCLQFVKISPASASKES